MSANKGLHLIVDNDDETSNDQTICIHSGNQRKYFIVAAALKIHIAILSVKNVR